MLELGPELSIVLGLKCELLFAFLTRAMLVLGLELGLGLWLG